VFDLLPGVARYVAEILPLTDGEQHGASLMKPTPTAPSTPSERSGAAFPSFLQAAAIAAAMTVLLLILAITAARRPRSH